MCDNTEIRCYHTYCQARRHLAFLVPIQLSFGARQSSIPCHSLLFPIAEMSISREFNHSLLLVLLLLSACVPIGRVESPIPAIESDRPDFTESTETVPPGSIQAEGGYAFKSNNGSTSHEIGELLLRVPAGTRAEVLLGFNSYTVERVPGLVQRGFEDMEVGMKVRLLAHEARSLLPNVSVLALSTLPTGQSDAGSTAIQPTLKLAFGWHLSEMLSLESNAGYSFAADDGTRFSQWSTSASLAADVTPRLDTFVEWFGTNPVTLGAGRADYLDAGAGIKFGQSLRLDASVGANVRSSRDYFVGFGISRRW